MECKTVGQLASPACQISSRVCARPQVTAVRRRQKIFFIRRNRTNVVYHAAAAAEKL